VCLELSLVEFIYGSAQIGHCLILDEAAAITVTAHFRVDDVKSGLPGKVFEVLGRRVSPEQQPAALRDGRPNRIQERKGESAAIQKLLWARSLDFSAGKQRESPG
jgi:hypothetical protein